jgi:hypothetical protein
MSNVSGASTLVNGHAESYAAWLADVQAEVKGDTDINVYDEDDEGKFDVDGADFMRFMSLSVLTPVLPVLNKQTIAHPLPQCYAAELLSTENISAFGPSRRPEPRSSLRWKRRKNASMRFVRCTIS